MIRRTVSRAQIAPFEIVIGILLVLSGVRFLWKEQELAASQIGQTLPLPQIWAAGYLLAGLLVLVGVLWPIARIEAAGLSLMAAVVSINAIAFAATYDVWAEWQFGVAFVFYLTLVLAAIARLRVLVKGRLVVFAESQAPDVVVMAIEQETADGH